MDGEGGVSTLPPVPMIQNASFSRGSNIAMGGREPLDSASIDACRSRGVYPPGAVLWSSKRSYSRNAALPLVPDSEVLVAS